MAHGNKKIDVAEWYKRSMIFIITVFVGLIAQDMSEMKGDIKVALAKSDFNEKRIDENKFAIEANDDAIEELEKTDLDHEKRLTTIESHSYFPAQVVQ